MNLEEAKMKLGDILVTGKALDFAARLAEEYRKDGNGKEAHDTEVFIARFGYKRKEDDNL